MGFYMPVYEYTALDRSGKKINGIVDADSAVIARQQLRNSEIFPVEINETSTGIKNERSKKISFSQFFSRAKSSDISTITRQMSVLLKAGLPLVSVLDTVMAQMDNPSLKKIMAQVKTAVNEGNSLAVALSQHPKIFSQIYINMVRAGEASGSLDLVLDRLADFGERQQALAGRVRAALTYPVFMLCIGILVLFFLMVFIVPDITRIFEEMQQVLPLPTQFLIGASSFLKSFWWAVALAGVAMIVAVKQFVNTPKGHYMWDTVIPGNKIEALPSVQTYGHLVVQYDVT